VKLAKTRSGAIKSTTAAAPTFTINGMPAKDYIISELVTLVEKHGINNLIVVPFDPLEANVAKTLAALAGQTPAEWAKTGLLSIIEGELEGMQPAAIVRMK
jgi:hypothetical protein